MKTENKLFRITLNAAEGSAEVTPLTQHQGFTTGDAVNGIGGELSFIIGSTENPLQVLKVVENILKAIEQELCLTSQQIWEDIHQLM